MTDQKRPRTAVRCCAVGLSILIALLAAETVVRVGKLAPPAGPAPSPLESVIGFDSKLGTRYKAGASTTVKSQYGEFEVQYRFNELGLRDRPLAEGGSARVLVLGNSLVEGWGVEEQEGFVRRTE